MDKEFIKDLVENKSSHIAMKKSSMKLTKGGLSMVVGNHTIANKSANKQEDVGVVRKTIVGNTYLYLDSQKDVLAKGVFAKSLRESGKNAFHLSDHDFKLTARIGDPVKIYEQEIAWKLLGVDKDGTTEALFMDSDIKKEYNERIYNDYKSGVIQQHSVGLRYQKLELAVNDESYEEEFKLWKSVIDQVANKEEAEKDGYFFYVKEAQLIEISAVLLGANPITPTIETSKTEEETKEQAIKQWLSK